VTDTEKSTEKRRPVWTLWLAAYVLVILSAGHVIEAVGDWLTGQPHDIPTLWAIVLGQQAAWFAGTARAEQRRVRP